MAKVSNGGVATKAPLIAPPPLTHPAAVFVPPIAPPPAPPVAVFVLDPDYVAIEVPMIKIIGGISKTSGSRFEPYQTDRVDATLDVRAQEALQQAFDGLKAVNAFSQSNPSPCDVVRWMLHRLADKRGL